VSRKTSGEVSENHQKRFTIYYAISAGWICKLKLKSFLRFPLALPACNKGQHLKFISILKDGFHPLEELDRPPVHHESNV